MSEVIVIKVDENSAQTAIDAAAASQAAFAALLSTSFGVAKPADVPAETGFGYWLSITPGPYPNHGGVVVNANSLALILRNAAGAYSVSQSALDLSDVVGPEGPVSTVPGPPGPQGSSLKVPTFINQAYAAVDSQVSHIGKFWYNTSATAIGDIPGTSTKWVELLNAYANKTETSDLLPRVPNNEIVNINYDYSLITGTGSAGSQYHMHRNYAVQFKGALRELSIKLVTAGVVNIAAFRVSAGVATLLYKFGEFTGVIGENFFTITDNFLLEVGDFVGVTAPTASTKIITLNSLRVSSAITTSETAIATDVAIAFNFKTSKTSVAIDILTKTAADSLYFSKEGGSSVPRLADAFYKWLNGEKYPIGIMGDSTTDGNSTTGYTTHTGADTSAGGLGKADHQPPNAYTTYLQAALRSVTGNNTLRIYNLGYAGTQINIYKNYVNALLSGPYADTKMMGIRYGINDRLLYTTYTAYYNALVTDITFTVNALLKKGIQPFLITSQPVLDSSKFLNAEVLRTSEAIESCLGDAIKKVSDIYNLEIVDLNSVLYTLMNESNYNITTIYGDSIHFGDLGHKLTSDAFFAKLYPATIFTEARDRILLSFDNQKIKSNLLSALTKYNTDTDGFKMKSNFTSSSDILIAEFTVFADRRYKIESYGTASVTVNGLAYTTNMIAEPGLIKIVVRSGAISGIDFRGFKLIKQ